MSRTADRIREAAGKRIEEVEFWILAREGRKSLKEKVAAAKRMTKKAVKAGLVAGAVVATAVVLRERKKRRDVLG